MGGIFSAPKAPPPPPAPEQAIEDRSAEEKQAQQDQAERAAKAIGRQALLNPSTGTLGVEGGSRARNPNSLFPED